MEEGDKSTGGPGRAEAETSHRRFLATIHADPDRSGSTENNYRRALGHLMSVAPVPPEELNDDHIWAFRERMDAKVSPETVQEQEYGYILGKVTSVGKYPATYQGMLRTLGNEDLVQALRAEGEGLSPIEVHIQLTPSERGYRWNSRREPDIDIQSGTPCSVQIVINSDRHPTDLILPQ